MQDTGLILKQEFTSTKKFQINQLTNVNVDILTKCLKKLLLLPKTK
jgi:hypothetical protein